jgi:formylglycine-generating enzyme required for sulfatase activity/dienelactone hydrolase/predicted Ser/Thr protein kinase
MSEVPELTAGQLVATRYRVLRVLDRGGMGVVYEAADEQLGRRIALKVLAAETQTDAASLEQFRTEARTLSALNHPSIVTIHEVGTIGRTPFIAMELVEGQTLGTRLRFGPLALRDALEVGVQVARALAAAHEKGIIHRDIKPENLMIRDDGYVKVLDFGIAVLRPQPAPGQTLLAAATRGNATLVVSGTPAYMSPEQIESARLDARSDLFSLGVTLCEALTGTNPFARPGVLDTLTSIGKAPAPAEPAVVRLPKPVRAILLKLMQKNPAHRYRSAAELATELQKVGRALDGSSGWRSRRSLVAVAAAAIVAAIAVGAFAWRSAEHRRWAREEVIPEIARLTAQERSALAFPLVTAAQRYLHGDPELARIAAAATRSVSIHSTPPGALVEVKDYGSPDEQWLKLGTTPLERVQIPGGYLRWKVSEPSRGEFLTAPFTLDDLSFDLDKAAQAPKGMVPVPGGAIEDYAAFFGAFNYELPPFYIDRFEVTNRDYQEFVDKGGYTTERYWKQPLIRDGQTITWNEAMTMFRDSTGRPGPATWAGGHYPEGRGDYPVAGVSWFEAAAYAEFAGKSLPVLAQAAKVTPNDADRFIVPLSNDSESLAPVGRFGGLGPYGTYDLVGNVREWYWNAAEEGVRFSLGRLANSYGPEALSPFDRSPLNGFRCVVNEGPMPEEARAPRVPLMRDFSKVTPASDEVFAAYRAMYAYDKTPLDAKVEGLPEDSEHWTRQKVTFNTAYGKQRMAAYLFLPKRVKPPFQVVAFFPSARVNELRSSDELGDLTFMDYVVQSGRAVVYPVYQSLYERQAELTNPQEPTVAREMIIDWSKDLGRSLDYLATREDIDMSRVGYLGVSQGAAYGVLLAAVEARLKAVVLLDGGFFQYEPIAGTDQADFAARLKKPVLMINGRYDWTFPPVSSSNPLFDLIGTAPADKRHVLFDTPHDVRVRREDLTKEVLAWLDAYLGKVN